MKHIGKIGWRSIICRSVIYLAMSGICHASPLDKCMPGGDGPHPLTDISDQIASSVQTLTTKGSVRDYLFWENKDQIVYRNNLGEIFFLGDLTLFSLSSKALARVRDDYERYLISHGDTLVLDTVKKQRWKKFTIPEEKVYHLFWKRDFLFSLGMSFDQEGNQLLQVYEYDPVRHKVRNICGTRVAKKNHYVELAEGSRYPDVYFYRQKKTSQGNYFTLFTMDLRWGCRFRGLDVYTRPVAGPVRKVHYFQSYDALALEMDHFEKNFLWASKSVGCQYYNVGGIQPLALNYDVPMIMTFSKNRGMSVIYPEKGEQAYVGKYSDSPFGSGIKQISQNDVSMDKRGETLYLSPLFEADNQRQLIKITLRNKP